MRNSAANTNEKAKEKKKITTDTSVAGDLMYQFANGTCIEYQWQKGLSNSLDHYQEDGIINGSKIGNGRRSVDVSIWSFIVK